MAPQLARLADQISLCLACRIPSPWGNLQVQHRLEIRRMLQHLANLMAAAWPPTLPDPRVNCAKDHGLIAAHAWSNAPEALSQLRLQRILVRDDQCTPRATTAGLAQGHQSPRIDMDQQRKLPQVCRSVTRGALPETFIRVQIEDEGVAGW
jgi:hypothetical protein